MTKWNVLYIDKDGVRRDHVVDAFNAQRARDVVIKNDCQSIVVAVYPIGVAYPELRKVTIGFEDRSTLSLAPNYIDYRNGAWFLVGYNGEEVRMSSIVEWQE